MGKNKKWIIFGTNVGDWEGMLMFHNYWTFQINPPNFLAEAQFVLPMFLQNN